MFPSFTRAGRYSLSCGSFLFSIKCIVYFRRSVAHKMHSYRRRSRGSNPQPSPSRVKVASLKPPVGVRGLYFFRPKHRDGRGMGWHLFFRWYFWTILEYIFRWYCFDFFIPFHGSTGFRKHKQTDISLNCQPGTKSNETTCANHSRLCPTKAFGIA